ncbi:hypothetical protein HZA43_00115 [Candidatus Peregrinibacteria bacterium]|nr:hypothetical protein [Candidatus Peregrinibacteria bacterium]
MKKIEALQILQKTNKNIFNTPDLRKLLGSASINTLNKQIAGLIAAGVLTRALKGFYYLTLHKPTGFQLANFFLQPSYISLESALNYYGILVQSPQQITSVTTKLTRTIESGGAFFSYAHLAQSYFSDYQMVDGFLIATPEKALVDAMFFTALGRGSLSIEELNYRPLLDKNKNIVIIETVKVKKIAARIENKAFKNYFKTTRYCRN